MNDSITMSSDEVRIKEVPSIEDLEKIEAYNEEEDMEGEVLQRFVQSELLERFVEKDDRYDSTQRALNSNHFEYGDVRGSLKNNLDSISGRVFRPEGRDMNDKALGMIGGAATGKTMHNKAMNSYQSALEDAGYDLDDPSEEELIETAEQALDEIDHENFVVDIDESTREAYGAAVQMIEEYRAQ